MEHTRQVRMDALDQLKQAQLMIEEGRKELAAANRKIKLAQKLIDESANALRGTPTERTSGRHTRPR